jgi:GntR family transcriptional regulator
MVTFKTKFTPGQSIFDQVCFAATKAILAGELKAGEPFPSVRALALDLKIHPNTAHKVVQHLIQERWLVAQPGVGTVGGTAAESPRRRPQAPA